MANLRELTGRSCVSGNLGMSDWSERPVDRVAALGYAAKNTALGVDVFRWLYARDQYAATRVYALLTIMIMEQFNMDHESALGIARQSMLEFGDKACRVCEGRGKAVLKNGVEIVCEKCAGSGLRKYTDRSRVRGAGFPAGTNYAKLVHAPVEYALDELRHADNVCNVSINLALERAHKKIVQAQGTNC